MRRFLRFATGLLALGLVATSCAVDPADVELIASDASLSNPGPDTDETAAAAADPTAPTSGDPADDGLLARVISGEYRSSDCDFVSVEFLPVEPECGWLTRPLHGGRGKDIELPVMVFKASGESPAPEPIVYLHGGPSGGILADLEYFYSDIVEPYLADRDVIVFDQRGTGLAKPDLRCNAPNQWFGADDNEPLTYVSRAASICAWDLEIDGIELHQFSRQRSADDVMVLVRELGYDSFNLHGSSWGGLLAYTVMQLHPDSVNAAILDSPLSISTDLAGSMPASFQEAMQAMQANCDRDPTCADRHPDIIGTYVQTVDLLDENPMPLTIFAEPFPAGNTMSWRVTLDGDELSYLLFGLLYSPDAVAVIPDLLVDLLAGDDRLVSRLASFYGWGWGIDFEFLTYMCTDIVPSSSSDDIAQQQLGISAFDRVDDAPDGRGETAEPLCEAMRVETPAAPALREQDPTTPTIVFSGSMDPITSRSSGQALAESMPNGTFVFFDDLTHGITHDPCAEGIALAFLRDPTAAVDRSCAEPDSRGAFRFTDIALTVHAPNDNIEFADGEDPIAGGLHVPDSWLLSPVDNGMRWWRDEAGYDLTMVSVLNADTSTDSGSDEGNVSALVDDTFAQMWAVEIGSERLTSSDGASWNRRDGITRWGLAISAYVHSDGDAAIIIQAYPEEFDQLEALFFDRNAQLIAG